MSLHGKCEKVRAVILDVDGVLTDGRIGYGAGSDEEIKFSGNHSILSIYKNR